MATPELPSLGTSGTSRTPRLSKQTAPWSLGTHCTDGAALAERRERVGDAAELAFSLHGPPLAHVNAPFVLQARVVNLSSASICDLHLETSGGRVFVREELQQQPRYVCPQASTPLKELCSGESVAVNLDILPLCTGQLRLDNILVVSAKGRIYRPAWFFTVPVMQSEPQDDMDDVEL